MFIVTSHEGQEINEGRKVRTLRPTRAEDKGYFRVGSLQLIFDSRNFKLPPVCRVLILERNKIDIRSLGDKDAPSLGYKSISDYLGQKYNVSNPSSERVEYWFVELSELYKEVSESEINPDTFKYYFDLCKGEKELIEGVNPSLVFEGCKIEDLESEFLALQGNIWGAIR